jgi:type II secretory pathway pseudopilin PulG
MPDSRTNTRRRKQRGYSLLMVVFLVATMLILASAATQNLLTQGRREREAEMVWRGEQYQRAIGLYFRKFGKYPTKVDDLVKQTNGVRFLRQAYTDPMNKEDGSWRFIYVGPNGQLIGSVRHTSLLQSVLSTPTIPGASTFGPPAPPATPGAANAGGVAGGALGPGGIQATGGLAPNPLESQPQPLQGTVIGGNIVGIGSKMKESSLRVYQGGDTYEQWEFIWNPQQQVAIPGQGPANPNAPPAPQPTGQPAPGTPPQNNPLGGAGMPQQQNPLGQ